MTIMNQTIDWNIYINPRAMKRRVLVDCLDILYSTYRTR